ncbi:magnesium/cobalt transporter CorA [Helicobacter cetorum]|uniref:Magnesium transport protein CorA n=1 Tax=Helicobacter cetorum (strain ATCC BAA-429 / MIT 00-7128) TaxID=182217 RepID=I0EKK5_HELC0|nr:magnesium/cobalt transporter CorA [Helicobacter cetorum]AFI03474.1 magnesium and cobalt transport protein [Helicobacter cetorum MIT 00-7128]
MVNVFFKHQEFVIKKRFNDFSGFDVGEKEVLWFELINPTPSELIALSQQYSIDYEVDESERVSLVTKYWEDSSSVTINALFVNQDEGELFHTEMATFILAHNILFTVYYGTLQIFNETKKKVLASPKKFEDGFDVLSKVFEADFERGVEYLEWINKQTSLLRKSIVFRKTSCKHDDVLVHLSNLQEFNMVLRNSLFDKRRIITALLRSDKVDKDTKNNLNIIMKDFSSLVESATVNLNSLDNIQNLFASQVNVEQNEIIKVFTVATMAMMPPTLIGTVYGMNFKFMPELEWQYGYLFALIIMAISTILPVIYFKKKGWL